MKHSYPIKVKDIRSESPDCVSIAFDIPSELNQEFKFSAGQYLTLIKNVNGEELHRSYSLCVSPLDNEFRVAIKKVQGGKFSTYASQILKAGDIIEVMPPAGKFTKDFNANHSKNYLFIAAGSGITPVLSILSTVFKYEPESNVCLIYGNTSYEHIIFRDQLLDLKNKYLDRFQLQFILSRELMDEEWFQGRINAEKINFFNSKLFYAEDLDEVFICGPETMILECKDSLMLLGLNESKIHFELFGTELQVNFKPIEIKNVNQVAKIKLKTDGRTVEFDLPYNTQSILDAALIKKLNLPFACKGGVCCTCKAKLIEGEVEMLRNYGLEPEELEAGFILTCQSFPKTDYISVDFDQ